MAKRTSSSFVCSNCGAVSTAWTGKCTQCGEWNTISEKLSEAAVSNVIATGKLIKPSSVAQSARKDTPRMTTGIKDFDTVLGGGVVVGSVSLLAGQPGIGKSTLMLQLASETAKSSKVLYVSGEESEHQVGLRARRLGATSTGLQLATATSADDIAATISNSDFDLVIVDSIQTLATQAISSSPGTVSQITNSTRLISTAAKRTGTAVILVGHVTKEGSIAGPKVLEHVVDVVLQLEGDRYGGFKMLRAAKNRFGSTTETAIFEMTETGMQIVKNPSAALLEERQLSDGSIVLATLEGTRPLLVEVQALVNPTSYGYAKRTASGFDINRLNLLIAVLERRTKLKLAEQDIYVNIVGGIQVREPAADLAVCLAIGSAAKGMQLKKNSVVFGEVGLSGEVRHVPFVDKRLAEAKKLGFDGGIGPMQKASAKYPGLHSVRNAKDALNQFLEKD